MQFESQEVFDGRDEDSGAVQIHFNGGVAHGLEGGLLHQHEVHRPCALCGRIELNEGGGLAVNRVAKFREQTDPKIARSAVYEQIEVSGVAGVAVQIHSQPTDDEEGQPAFPSFVVDLLEQPHRNGLQRPVVNVVVARRDEAAEKRVRAVRLAQKFRVELAGQIVGMLLEFDHFHELAVGAGAAEDESVALEFFAVGVVEFVAVAVPLVDDKGAVELLGLAAHHELAGLRAQPHGAAFLGDVPLGVEQGDDGMRGVFVELGGIGLLQLEDIARKFDAGDLHAQTEAEVG